jgi:cysteine desulfurase
MRCYFDNSATTPLDPRVREAMLPYLENLFGNPSSLHADGLVARRGMEEARRDVAALLGAEPDEIIFTASGTEAINLALLGVIGESEAADRHVITSAIEHPAVLMTCRAMEKRGTAVTRLPVGSDGIVEPAALATALRPNTRLVSIMAANNVVGAIQPIEELARITHAHGALFHCDAVQAIGKIPLDMSALPVDLLSLSAHKLYGPKGVGALYVRRGVRLAPLIHGGGQERGVRSATENVAGICGLGRAAAIARAEMADDAARLVGMRDRLLSGIAEAVPGVYLFGHPYRRLPGHLCIGLAGHEGDAIRLLLLFDDAEFSLSSGSACSSSHIAEPSAVLLAMGFDPVRARGSLRITLGRFTTDAEVDRFIEIFPRIFGSLTSIYLKPHQQRRQQ